METTFRQVPLPEGRLTEVSDEFDLGSPDPQLYTFFSQVVVMEVLTPAVMSEDWATAQPIFDLLESMLTSDDRHLQGIAYTSAVEELAWASPWLRAAALAAPGIGPRLRAQIIEAGSRS